MKIKWFPTIDFEDIQEHFHWAREDVAFTSMVENGSYLHFETDSEAIDEMKNNIDYARKIYNPKREKQYRNELQLIYALREFGLTKAVLIYLGW